MPFGSVVRVVNLENDSIVYVKINDLFAMIHDWSESRQTNWCKSVTVSASSGGNPKLYQTLLLKVGNLVLC